MEAYHDFSASKHMYEEHFKEWGVRKDSKRTKTDDIDEDVLRHTQTQVVLSNPNTNKYDNTNNPKLSQEMDLANAIDPGTLWSRPKVALATHDSHIASGYSQSLIPDFTGCDSLNDSEYLAIGTDDRQTSHVPVASGRVYVPSHTVDRMPDHASSEFQVLETILRSVHLCIACPEIGYENQVLPLGRGPQELFWGELKHGIYLLKISADDRAFPVLHKTVQLAPGAFAESPTSFVQELFSTLSPVNTTKCSAVRLSLLRAFSDLAKQSLGGRHPVTIICSELQEDRTSREISERCLSFMIDLLTSMRGMSYALTITTQLALIQLLRRNKDIERAGIMARTVLSSSTALFGVHSLSARLALRALEHVLMDQNEWRQALEVCSSIVGQASSTEERVEPQHHDECAIHTMEDIAKIYDNLGRPESCIAWLDRAAKSAYNLFGSCAATTHIIDKLVGAFVGSGEHEDAKLWQWIRMARGDGVL
ncbi:hypothetical protein IMSHALPRED_010416 [Imshaugia aleurites]|uniref:Clr5 domain-containing protein n=1 Tax=Imshaugia aleurites TaxID=172621 RepID=A0A8H3IW12_9LECA|nr:hypothetical protein IMSHALPRED_010416 [Imshaugia aleurites]